MSAASNFTENLALNWLLTAESATRPTAWFVALFTADGGLEAGTTTNEVSGGAYARQSVAFDPASNGATANSATVTFPAATANWGTVTHIAVMSASTGGEVLFHGPVTASKTIELGDVFQIAAGNLNITLD